MTTNQSSSPSDSTQFFSRPVRAPAHSTSLVEQQLRLSLESPQLLAAIEALLPLAKAEYRELSGPRSSSCDPRTAELIKNEAGAWAIGIALAEDALERNGRSSSCVNDFDLRTSWTCGSGLPPISRPFKDPRILRQKKKSKGRFCRL
jgi:hypothetical protein